MVARELDIGRPFGDPAAVAQRPCRMCGELVDVTEAGMAALRACNAILLGRSEAPLNELRTFACERCAMKARDAAGKANRLAADEMTAIIQDLKESSDPPSEKAMLDRLAELGHPDIPSLLLAIGEKRNAEKGRKR